MKRLINLALFLIIPISCLIAQVDTDDKEYKPFTWPNNRLGAVASMFSGFGLSYQYHFMDKYALKFSGFVYGESNSGDMNYSTNQNLYATVGLECQLNLHKTKYTRFHAFAASSLWYDDYSSYYTYDMSGKTENSTINRAIVGGIGFGFEFLAWKIISFNIETGLQGRFGTVSRVEKSPNSSFMSITHPRSFGFGIGGGISYAF
jgi:hypothetical protein